MNKSEFLKAYYDSCETVYEGRGGPAAKNPQDYIGMLSPLAPADLPPGIVSPAQMNNAAEAASHAREQTGKAAASYKTAEGVEVVRYNGGDRPQGESFRIADWTALVNLYNQQKDQLGAEKPDMGDQAKADAEKEQPQQLDPELPVAGQEQFVEAIADENQAELTAAFDAYGLRYDPSKLKAFSRQALGMGQITKLRKVAERFGLAKPAQETIEGAKELNQNVIRALDIADRVKRGESIRPDDVDFVQKCFKFRGTGKNVGLWTKCGALADDASTDEEAYGLKIGTDGSPIYQALTILEENEAPNGKPFIIRGRADSSETNAFNAIVNDLQESMVNVAHVLYVEKDPKKAAKELKRIAGEMGSKFNTALFTRVMTERLGGDLDELENPDEQKVVATMLAQSLQQFKNLVEAFPDCKNFKKVGGVTGRKGGKKVTADIQAECIGIEAYDDIVTNKKYDVPGREHESGELRISLKQDSGGKVIYNGKMGLALARDLANEDVRMVREDHSRLLEKIDKDGRSAEDIQKAADKAREEEVKSVDAFIANIAAVEPGAIRDIALERLSQLGYEDSVRQRRFFDRLEEFNKIKDPDAKEAARKELLPIVTQAWRQSNQNTPGFRENMALEYLSTAASSERQALALNSGGETYMAMETDVLGPVYDQILNGGTLRFTETQMAVEGEEGDTLGTIGLRLKEGTPIQDATTNKKSAMSRMKKMEALKKTESLRAEDFVRQLQELMQRIDKVRVV
jgi:hypothetical protein